MPVLATDGSRSTAQAAPPGMRSDASDRHGRARFDFLVETSRLLAASPDFRATITDAAALALPLLGTWCVVDFVEQDGTLRREDVLHEDAGLQRMAREFYRDRPPGLGDALAALRLVGEPGDRTATATPIAADALAGITDPEELALMRALGARAFLVVRLRTGGRDAGTLTFVADADRSWDDADLLLAEDLGRRCAVAIDNARLLDLAQRARLAERRAIALHEATERARLHAESANRSKASFLTTVSHEIRTPLHAILGFVGLLQDELGGPLSEVQRHYVTRIGNASGSLLRLVDEVLTLSSVEAGHAPVRRDDVDLSAILLDVVALLDPLLGARRIALMVDVPAHPMRFPMDAGKFRQIVINLASNAMKFTAAGEVCLALREDADGIELRVRDTGEGVSESDAEHIFDAFAQGSAPAHLVARGSGLGLAITRQLARLMGGDVRLERPNGPGSSFVVRLPRVPLAATTTAGLHERRARPRADTD